MLTRIFEKLIAWEGPDYFANPTSWNEQRSLLARWLLTFCFGARYRMHTQIEKLSRNLRISNYERDLYARKLNRLYELHALETAEEVGLQKSKASR